MKRDPADHRLSAGGHPTCSVAVCTRDRPEALAACLAAIAAGTGSATELIVIDSAPERTSAEGIAARWGAAYFREPRPGLSRARNRAARESRAEVLAFVDDDALPESGWLEPLLAAFADPTVALAGGRVWPPKVDEDLFPLYGAFGIYDLGDEGRVVDRTTPNWFVTANFRSFVIGANMAVRRSVYDRWGGFDERMGAGALIPRHEESRAFFELVCLGYRVAYAPDSMVRHAYPRVPEQLRPRAISTIESTAAYVTLLFCEEAAHRKDTWGYVARKLEQIASLSEDKGEALLSAPRVALARLKGIFLYFAARLSSQGRRRGERPCAGERGG